jgi:hypothetical protein
VATSGGLGGVEGEASSGCVDDLPGSPSEARGGSAVVCASSGDLPVPLSSRREVEGRVSVDL